MDLTTAGLITGAVGFIVGSMLTTIIFMIVTGSKKSKLKKESLKRHEIIGSIGKKCAEIDHAYSEYRIGKIPFESLGAMILEKIEDVSTELNSNSDILDAFYIKNIERFLQDQKSYLMNGVSSNENQERNSVRPFGMPSQEEGISPSNVAIANTNISDSEIGIQEISAEESKIEEFSVEATDEAEEFHIEEEPSFEPAPKETAPVQDSAFEEPAAKIDMGEDANFDFNATTVLSVDEIRGAISSEDNGPNIQTPPQAMGQVQSASLEGQSLLAPEVKAQPQFKEPEVLKENTPVTPPPPPPAPTVQPQQQEAAPAEEQQQQPFVDMDATQVYDQTMFQAATGQQPGIAPQQPKSPLQFEQPIPEPPTSSMQTEQEMPQQPIFQPQVQPQQQPPKQPLQQQSLSAFDVEATQEFHVSDIMQHAQHDTTQPSQQGGSEEIFEINMPNSASQPSQPQKPKNSPKGNDMVSGDDVANQMDNFFGFD